MRIVTLLALALPLSLPLAGCLGAGERAPGFSAPPPPGPVATAADTPPPIAEVSANTFAPPQRDVARGSIFQASQGYANLVTGTRARQLGDMLTIVLIESTTTNKSTTGQTDRSGGFAILPPTAGPLDFLNPNALTASAQGDFDGSGLAAQQSQLNGRVAVTIAAIYPNGTAEVVGEKQMALSQGDEWVQFAGRIRLVDIDSENRLPSSLVANARIIYSGKGAVQQASRPGWLSRFFNAISPL
ncbi:MAG: flagellar basal body L-ring protein FlgH [Erythrobacter sp.]|jgi:flagellar L-ring protein precursor FlgH|nr:flagellar basal body L-ring protein FlgH [Erythrobacter sp.]